MIIVFGSMNIDMVMMVDHFPVAGETVLCPSDYLTRSGGKGANQAIAAARAGARVAMVGKVGDDSFGRRSVNALKKQSILTSGVGISERPTGCAMIAVNRTGENMVMVAPSANLDTTEDQIPDELLTERNTILTQLEVAPEETFKILVRAKKGGSRTILNASPARVVTADVLKTVDYIIMNEIESLQIAQGLGVAEGNPAKRARAIAGFGKNTCLISMGGQGSVAAVGNDVFQIGTLPIDPIDTTGAGDAYCGIFAASLEAGLDLATAMHRASVGASLSCLGIGAQAGVPFIEDILEKLPGLAPPERLLI